MSTPSKIIQRKLERVAARRSGALTLFEQAHQALVDSAEAADRIAGEADAHRRQYETLAQAADQESATARKSAAQLASLLGKG